MMSPRTSSVLSTVSASQRRNRSGSVALLLSTKAKLYTTPYARILKNKEYSSSTWILDSKNTLKSLRNTSGLLFHTQTTSSPHSTQQSGQVVHSSMFQRAFTLRCLFRPTSESMQRTWDSSRGRLLSLTRGLRFITSKDVLLRPIPPIHSIPLLSS